MKFFSKKLLKIAISLSLVAVWFLPADIGYAQEGQPDGPVYNVQDGDTLWDIALRFGVSVEELEIYNGITDASQITVGTELVIPGMEGVQGILVTKEVPYGENLRSLSRRYQVPKEALARLNRIASPNELFTGAYLIIPEGNAAAPATDRVALAPGRSLLELAVRQGVNPWTMVTTNGLKGTWDVLPGDVLRVSEDGAVDGPGGFPGRIKAIEVGPLPMIQGKTSVIRLTTQDELTAGGALANRELNFFQLEDGWRYFPGCWIQ